MATPPPARWLICSTSNTPPAADVVLRIGTRRSPLALAQAREVADLLASRGVDTELVPLLTSGDRDARVAASPFGVKGLFVEEIVRALMDGKVDLAVHSAKDLPAEDPEGVVVGAVPERADPFDVLVTRDGALGDGSVVGTSSLRRRAQLLAWRPGLAVRDIRGNVDTRLRKLSDGDVDALVLAAAGLGRLGLAPDRTERLGVETMVPAPGQGALAVQARADDLRTRDLVRPLSHVESTAAFDAERALVRRLGGGCALPIGAFARWSSGGIRLVAVVANPDGTQAARCDVEAPTTSGVAEEAARALVAAGAAEILDGARPGA
jgi:hydroxymethylbilane synthase